MNTDLTSRDGAALALVDRHQGSLTRAIEPTWGMFNASQAFERNEVSTENLPSISVLEGMHGQLLRSLAPLSDLGARGLTRALAAAKEINESYPQKDATGPAWARGVAARLAECPPDLLPGVMEGILNRHDYRPALAEVKRAVAEATATRKLTLLRVEAGLRWYAERRRRAMENATREAVTTVS